MAQLNKVFLMGNLTRDPEVRRLNNGRAVAGRRSVMARWIFYWATTPWVHLIIALVFAAGCCLVLQGEPRNYGTFGMGPPWFWVLLTGASAFSITAIFSLYARRITSRA